MFDFDSAKIVLFAAVALLVVGPRELPAVLRVVGRAVAQLRRVRNDLRKAAEGLMADASLDQEVAMIDDARLALARNPATAMRGGHRGADAIETTATSYASPEMLAYLAPPPEATACMETSEDVR